jgi:hypothetical protein
MLAALDLSCLDPPSLAAARSGGAASAAAPSAGEVSTAGPVPASFPLPAVQDVRFLFSLPDQ